MRGHLLAVSVLICSLAVSCSTGTSPAAPEPVAVYATMAAQPWLAELYDCAGIRAVLSRVDEPSAAEIILRLGAPEFLDIPAYQIDNEDVLIVAHRQSPVQNLSLEQVRTLFSGLGDPAIQVWVYAAGEDIQEIFERTVMEGSVAPTARLAADPQQMADTLVDEPNSVGILPRRWVVGNIREVFIAATVPVLAMSPEEPQGIVRELIACLQN